MAKIRLVQPAEEIISNLASDPQAELKITVEINAHFPNGATDQIKRAVSENAKSLRFKLRYGSEIILPANSNLLC